MRSAIAPLTTIALTVTALAACTPEDTAEATKRQGFAAFYRANGAMMGSACNKVVVYGGTTGFALKCPGISQATARRIMADPNNPLAKDLRAAGFKYYSISDLPEEKL